MKIKYLILFGIVFPSLLSSCKYEKNGTPNEEASKSVTALEVVENAMLTAGTLEKWQSIASLAYTKKSRLLLENGEVESEVIQHHSYQLRPHKNIKISWAVEKDSFLLVHNDSVSQKFKNGHLVEEGKKVQETVNSSLYVLGMPFKLVDKGTVLRYEGLQSLNGIDTVHTVNATYAPEKHQNHSTQDEWWYHFGKDNGIFLSSMVYHEPTYALIENRSRTKIEGLSFPEIRKSYRCTREGKKVFLRAEFWYSDYEISFLNN